MTLRYVRQTDLMGGLVVEHNRFRKLRSRMLNPAIAREVRRACTRSDWKQQKRGDERTGDHWVVAAVVVGDASAAAAESGQPGMPLRATLSMAT